MARQHVNPYFIDSDEVHQLDAIHIEPNGQYNEAWLQDFIYRHPLALPVKDIEPIFAPLIPVCRELATDAGPIDVVYVNPMGLLTLVECKLWKNPEARREVVGQILDYAKELSRWSYEHLEAAIATSKGHSGKRLYELVDSTVEVPDQAQFIDSISRNLKRGRFLLMIAGDGIRESVEQIGEFLQRHTHLNFSFALVEMGIFTLPAHVGAGCIVQPRVLARTVEIERAVIRIEDGQVVASAPAEVKTGKPGQRSTISEQAFFENVQVDDQTAERLQQFFKKVQDLGLELEPGQNSIKLKLDQYDLNFGVFRTINEFYNCGMTYTTQELGYPHIGEQYLDRLASLFPNGYVHKTQTKFYWSVKIKPGRFPTIAECLTVQDQWLNIIQETLDEIAKTSR
jgi:hypothetical protein